VLNPGVFLNKLNPVSVDEGMDSCKKHTNNKAKPKMYPIEIIVGGNICNIGVEPAYFTRGSNNGIITLFF
jgi:hypothetical protein